MVMVVMFKVAESRLRMGLVRNFGSDFLEGLNWRRSCKATRVMWGRGCGWELGAVVGLMLDRDTAGRLLSPFYFVLIRL